jgi:hypothetical protein
MPPAILTDICHDFPQSFGTNSGTVPSNRPWIPLCTRCTWSSPGRVPWSWSTGDNMLTNRNLPHDFTYDVPPPLSRTQLQFYNSRRQKLTLCMEQGSSQGCRDISTFSEKRRFNCHSYRLTPSPCPELYRYCRDCLGSIPSECKRFLSSPRCSHRLWGPPCLLSNGYRGLSPPSNAEVKNAGATRFQGVELN